MLLYDSKWCVLALESYISWNHCIIAWIIWTWYHVLLVILMQSPNCSKSQYITVSKNCLFCTSRSNFVETWYIYWLPHHWTSHFLCNCYGCEMCALNMCLAYSVTEQKSGLIMIECNIFTLQLYICVSALPWSVGCKVEKKECPTWGNQNFKCTYQ
jgi:hypothetical protein